MSRPLQTFRLTGVIDSYLIETREVKAPDLKHAKTKFRKLFGQRKVASVKPD